MHGQKRAVLQALCYADLWSRALWCVLHKCFGSLILPKMLSYLRGHRCTLRMSATAAVKDAAAELLLAHACTGVQTAQHVVALRRRLGCARVCLLLRLQDIRIVFLRLRHSFIVI